MSEFQPSGDSSTDSDSHQKWNHNTSGAFPLKQTSLSYIINDAPNPVPGVDALNHVHARHDGALLALLHQRVHLQEEGEEGVGKEGRLMKRRYKVQSASNARSQGLVKSFCGSSPGQWAILQLLCSQARGIFQEELPRKCFNKT